MKKKIFGGLIILLLVGNLFSCGSGHDTDYDEPEDVQEEVMEEEDTEEVTEEATTEATTEKKVKKAKKTSAIDPDFKKMMDNYEDFMDEYVDFMESYDASDATALMKYAKLMEKYEKFATQVDDVDEDELNDAELAYYIDVTARVEKKLLSID